MNLRRIGRAKRVPVRYITIYTMIRRSYPSRRMRNPKKIMKMKGGFNVPQAIDYYQRNVPLHIQQEVKERGLAYAQKRHPQLFKTIMDQAPRVMAIIGTALTSYRVARDVYGYTLEGWKNLREGQRGLPSPKDVLKEVVDKSKEYMGIPKKINDVRNDKDKAPYKRVVNKGTGITRTIHKSGKSQPLPKKLKSVGISYKTVIADQAEDYFTISTDPAANGLANTFIGTINGIGNQIYLTAGDLKAGLDDLNSHVSYEYLTDLNSNFYIRDFTSTTRITSASNANCTLRIYELVARRNVPYVYASTPLEAWKYGIDIHGGVVSAGTTANTQPDGGTLYQRGIYPSHSKVFKHFWKVEAYYDVNLPAGATHIHTTEVNIHQEIPNFLFLHGQVGATHAFGGLTRARLYVLTGSPIHDQTSEGNVSMGIVKVDMVSENTTQYYGIPLRNRYINVSNKPDTITTGEILGDTSLGETGLQN